MKQLSFHASGQAIIDSTFVVLDCETTGLNPKTDAITELAAIKICGGKVIGSFHCLLNPEQTITARIAMLTGITQEQVKDCPTFAELAPTFLEFLGNAIIVGHNVRFDINFLNAGLQRANYQKLANPFLDTLTMAKKIIPNEVPNFKLSTLAHYCNAQTLPTHRAYADVQATIDVFHYLIERSSSIGIAGIKDLFTLPSVKKRERFIKRDMAKDAPRAPGIYMFVSNDDEILYVGTSKNIKQRLYSYFVSDDRNRISKMLKCSSRIEYITTPTPFEGRIAELRLLQSLAPLYNVADVRTSRMNYVVADPKELAPTFRVKTKPLKSETLRYGPFPSRKAANEFCEAIIYVLGLRSCANICEPGKTLESSACINSLRAIHSCFCVDDFESLETYKHQFLENIELFNQDFTKFSAKLLSEMNAYSAKLQFEKAMKLHLFAIAIQKWMNRIATITHASKVLTHANNDCPEIHYGIARVRYVACQQSKTTSRAIEIIKTINDNSTDQSTAHYKNNLFISDKSQFRERHYVANFLARNSLRNNKLNTDTLSTEVIDQSSISSTTIE